MSEKSYSEYLNKRLEVIISQDSNPSNYCGIVNNNGENEYYLFDGKTKERIKGPFKDVKEYPDDGVIVVIDEHSLRSVIDYDGKNIIKKKYDSIEIDDGVIMCMNGNYKELYGKDGIVHFGPTSFGRIRYCTKMSYNFSSVTTDGVEHAITTIMCVTEDLYGYQIERIENIFNENMYTCKKCRDVYEIKYYPIKIYNARYTLCVDWENNKIYLFDRKVNKEDAYKYIGDIIHVEFRDNFIFVKDKNANFIVYLIYNNNCYNITNYYEEHFGHEYDIGIRVKKDEELLTEEEHILGSDYPLLPSSKTRDEIIDVEDEESRMLARQNDEYRKMILFCQQILTSGTDSDEEILIKLSRYLRNFRPSPKRFLLKDDVCIRRNGFWEVKEEYKRAKDWINRYFDNFDNVNVEGVDFSDCVIHFDPQKVYGKSLKGCKFISSSFFMSTNFTGVNICGCEFSDVLSNEPIITLKYNCTLKDAIRDDATIYNGLPLSNYFPSTDKRYRLVRGTAKR